MKEAEYEAELHELQVALVRLQRAISESGRRTLVIFEGRDAAGKGGAIRRFTENLSPRSHRVVALPKPSDVEQGQWYFERYVEHLPNRGEMVFFDRSWFNRAVVEPVMGFCTPAQYEEFIEQVPRFEQLLVDDGIELIKLWFTISREEQDKRIEARRTDPLKEWKISSIDEQARSRWDDFEHYVRRMLHSTHIDKAPWTLIRTDKKKIARLESIRYVLNALRHEPRSRTDPDVVVTVDPRDVPHHI